MVYKTVGRYFYVKKYGGNDKVRRLTHEEFVKRVQSVNSNIQVLGEYVNENTKIKFGCQFGHTWYTSPYNIMNKHSGCPYCSGKIVDVGRNDLWTVRPDIAQSLENKEDGYKYSSGSSKEVYFICPDCGNRIKKSICSACIYGLACKKCSDGISYPNKFGRAFLDQLPIDKYETEYSPKWALGYSYDNYFEYSGHKYILEMDGGLHYNEKIIFSTTIEERKYRDTIKDELAKQNGIDVIRIDCCESDCDYIKTNIINSKLSDIFKLSNIDWRQCDRISQTGLVRRVCDLYNSGICDIIQLKNIFHLNRNTVAKYLKKGASLGFCDYTIKKSIDTGNAKKMRPVILIDNKGDIIKYFTGITTCIKEMSKIHNIDLRRTGIINSCKTHKPYKGFNFRYADDNNYQNKIEHLIDTAPLDYSDEAFWI